MQVIYSRNLAYYVTGLTAKSWCPTNRVKAPKAITTVARKYHMMAAHTPIFRNACSFRQLFQIYDIMWRPLLNAG